MSSTTSNPLASTEVDASTIHPDAKAIDPRISGRQRNIGWLFGGTGLLLFTLMALIGVAMRFTQAGTLEISPEWFYRLMTLHAAGMLAGTLLSMLGGLWYVVRSAVPDLNYGRAIASYLSIMVGVVLVLVAVLIGGFAAGWTFLFPLPFNAAGMWSTWATVVFLIGMSLVGVGFLLYCIDTLKACTERFHGLSGTLGITWLLDRKTEPPPPQVIAATAVSIQGIIASAVGMTIMLALLDHAIDGTVALDPLWAKNLTYFFGHTLANLLIYLGAGIIYVLLPLYSGRQWKTTMPIVIGWLATITFVLTAYFHHLYMDFAQVPAFQLIGLVASSAAALPVAVVTIYTGLMLVWGSRYRWTLTSVLLYLGFAGWTIGGIGAVIDSLIPVNVHFHNTLWVPAHFHNYLLMGVSLWSMALISYLLERASGRTATRWVSIFAPVTMVIGGYGLMYAWYISGALGVPRRWAVHPEGAEVWSLIGSLFAVLFLIGFFVMVFEFVRMGREAWGRRGAKSASRSAETPQPTRSSSADAANGSGFQPLITTYWGTVAAIVVAIMAMLNFFPPMIDASEVSDKFHHLAHGAQFVTGVLLGAVVGSAPAFLRRFRGRINLGLIVVVIAPVVMLLLMIPVIYGDLETNDSLHAAYHLTMVLLGLATGLGAATLGRVAGWTVLCTSIMMALLFAPGVTGG